MPSLEFKRIELSDKERVNNFLYKTNSNSCQMTFANLFCLREKYNTEICIHDNFLFIRQKNRNYNGDNNQIAYFVPIGSGNLESAISLIIEKSRKDGHRPYFFAVTDDTKAELENLDNYEFCIEEQEDWAEYIYNSKKLVDFSSSDLSKQRRAVNRFWNLYGEETKIEKISESNIKQLLKYQSKWLKENIDRNMDSDSLIKENISICNALENFDKLDLEGIIIFVGKSIRGYGYGTILPGGAFDIIAQKGDISYQQVYKVVLQEHVKTYYERAELTNMEEDIGLIGLRRSKTRYRPEYMLKKYTAAFK